MTFDLSKVPTNAISRLMGTCPMYLQWYLILASMTQEHHGRLSVGHHELRLTRCQTAFTLSSLRQRLAWVSATGREVRPQYKELRRFLDILKELGLIRVRVKYSSVLIIVFISDSFDSPTLQTSPNPTNPSDPTNATPPTPYTPSTPSTPLAPSTAYTPSTPHSDLPSLRPQLYYHPSDGLRFT